MILCVKISFCMTRRKLSDVWNAINNQKPSEYNYFQWKQSFLGVSAALASIGLVLKTSEAEFECLPVPEYDGDRRFMERRVIVLRNGIESPPTPINNLLSGQSSLQTKEELAIKRRTQGEALAAYRMKGVACSHQVETKASTDVAKILNLNNYLQKITLFEGRLADQAYCKIQDDTTQAVFVADQEKSALETSQGQLAFKSRNTIITYGGMLKILQTGYSLTMIGRRKSDGQPDVIWLFFGSEAISALRALPATLTFAPRLHLKIKSSNPATLICNNSSFRFEIGSSSKEIDRLLQRRVQIVEDGDKHSLDFLNDDLSQIPCPNGKTEHMSFMMTRAACHLLGAKIEHFAEDSYSRIDFRLDKKCRIQDKVTRDNLYLRSPGGYPINPDDADILQITDLKQQIVYAVPLRVEREDKIISYFTEDQLMKRSIWLSAAFKDQLLSYHFDMKQTDDIQGYINICEKAHQTPAISDQSFYLDIINKHAGKFGAGHRNSRKI